MEPKGLYERWEGHTSPRRNQITDLTVEEYVRHLTAPSPRSQAKHLKLRDGSPFMRDTAETALNMMRQTANLEDPGRFGSKTKSRSRSKSKQSATTIKKKSKKAKSKVKHTTEEFVDPISEYQDQEIAQITAILEALKKDEIAGANNLVGAQQRVQQLHSQLETLKKELQCQRKEVRLCKHKKDLEIQQLKAEMSQMSLLAQEGWQKTLADTRDELELTRIDWKRLRTREEELDDKYAHVSQENASLESQFSQLTTHADLEQSIKAQRSLLESLRSQILRENELRPQLIQNLTKLTASRDFLSKQTEDTKLEIKERRRGCELLDKEHQVFANGQEEQKLTGLRAAKALKLSELKELRKVQEDLAHKLKIETQDRKFSVVNEPEAVSNLKADVAHLDADKELLARKVANLDKQISASRINKEKMSADLKRLEEIETSLVKRYVEIKSEVKKVQLELIGPTKQSRLPRKQQPSDNPFRSPDVASARLTEISQKYSSLQASERMRKDWRDYRAQIGLGASSTQRSARSRTAVQDDDIQDQEYTEALEDQGVSGSLFCRKLGLGSKETVAMVSKGNQGRFVTRDSKAAQDSGLDLASTQDTKLAEVSGWKHRSLGVVALKSQSTYRLEPLAEETEV